MRSRCYKALEMKMKAKDSTFEFERKRNRPKRYDRNVTDNTLKAIKKIDKIRVYREERHIAKRMKGKKAKDQREAAKELEQNIHLIEAPAAPNKEPSLTLPAKVPVTQKQSRKIAWRNDYFATYTLMFSN
ncbi:putative ribosome biogenesis protein RLP24 [Capsicum baccatum]|uniref:Ribosome biogenesis protein RLP24 n=1 Tax=Capsicum baccatum TaxID=33114 RepID=A0A2G2WDY4_CAPBA|nr:putative ribosome biogenesis protein RLP24 [Capsicum baccatum]